MRVDNRAIVLGFCAAAVVNMGGGRRGVTKTEVVTSLLVQTQSRMQLKGSLRHCRASPNHLYRLGGPLFVRGKPAMFGRALVLSRID